MSIDLAKVWPSFIIQGIILATNTSFLLKGGEAVNIYILLSFLLVLILFSLQTTNHRFIYLFPVNETDRTISLKSIDTYILKYGIMFSIFFLVMGVYSQNKGVLGPVEIKFTIPVFIFVFIVVVFIPGLFEHIFNKKIRDRLNPGRQNDQ